MSSSINLKLGARKPGDAGSPDASAIEMERRIIWIRWLAILVSLGALPFLASSLNRQSLVTLLALIGLGAIYNLTLLVVILPRRPAWLTSGYISAIGDVLLVTGGVAVTGGLASPFFLAYFVVTVTTAVRFGGLAAIVAVLTIALSYTAVVYYGNAVQGTALTANNLTDLAMRTGFVALTGIFVGFVGDRARRAERALQEELERAHASLSEVTVELNRDLEFEQTCQLAAERRRLPDAGSDASLDRPGRVDAAGLDALRRLDSRAEGAPCRGRPDHRSAGADARDRRAGDRGLGPQPAAAQRAQAAAGRHVVPDPGLPRRPRDRRHDRRLPGTRTAPAPDRARADADLRRARRHCHAQRPRPRPGAEAVGHRLGDRPSQPPLLPHQIRQRDGEDQGYRRVDHGNDDRPRPLQGLQRQLRPRRR